VDLWSPSFSKQLVAGIGGLALGVFLLLFRDIIRKNIFPKLPAPEAYRLSRLITWAVWSIAVIGIGAGILVSHGSGVTVKAYCSVGRVAAAWG
jgi:hypothetical protein